MNVCAEILKMLFGAIVTFCVTFTALELFGSNTEPANKGEMKCSVS